MRSILLVFIFMSTFATHGAEANVVGQEDSIVLNDTASNVPDRFRGLPDAVGQLTKGARDCTVSHIGHGVVITAGHCFHATPVLNRELPCGDITVTWGVYGTNSGVSRLSSKCVRILAMQTDIERGLDWAVFTVDRIPPTFFTIDRSGQLPSLGEELAILSHAHSGPQRLSLNCRVKEQSFLPTIPFLYHDCDTASGSSGAAVLDDATGIIVGIHSGGIDESTNAATPIMAILKYLR